MKNVIKGFAFASAVLFLAACKNDKPATENASAISGAASTPTTTEAATPTTAATTTPVATTPEAVASKASDAAVKSVAASAAQPAKVTPSTAAATPAPAVVAGGKTTSAKFDEINYDWGTIAEGEKMTHIFKFKNTGTNDMIISDAHGSCGCTVPEWPKEPIKPGKSSQIKVIFDSKGKLATKANLLQLQLTLSLQIWC